MNESRPQLIFDLMHAYAPDGIYRTKPDVLAGKVKGEWVCYSGKDYYEKVNDLSAALLELGIQKGDTVATILKNCPEWNLLDMALMQTGAVQVPIYPTISPENFRYIFLDAEVKYIFISGKDIFRRVESAVEGIPSLLEIFTIEKTEGRRTLQELIDRGSTLDAGERLKEIRSGLTSDDIATIIYTSGTTGNPKGVMLSHNNFIVNFMELCDILPKNFIFRALSFLPLCHVYERVLNYMYQRLGISVYYSETVEALAQNLKEIHPEMFCAVPRVIEKFFDKIIAKGRGLKGIRKQIFFWAVNLGYDFELYGRNSAWYKMKHRLADRLVFSKWREALGGNIKVIVSGGAALQPRLAHIFWAAGIEVHEGYGLTETSPVIAVHTFERDGVRIGTVGPIMKCAETKIAPDGEILTRGPCVMKGYYKHPELTREVMDEEGWFHTGDIGYLEDGKYLKITDRKKEIFKTSGGKFIAPQALENKFKESAFIENLMVVGDNQPYPAALILPSFEYIRNWAKVKGIHLGSDEEIANDPVVYKRIWHEVNDINKSLDKTEQVKKIRLVNQEWTVEGGELSPTLKLRRKILCEKYQSLIEALFTK